MAPLSYRSALLGTGVLAGLAWGAEVRAADEPPAEGSVDFTPAVAVDGFYRTNLYLQEGEAGGGAPTVAGGGFQIRPTLDLRTRSRQVWLDAGVGYTARLMVPKRYASETDGGIRFDEDGNVVPDLSNLYRFNLVDGNARLVLFPKSVLGLKLTERAALTGRETEAVSATDAYLMMFRNEARGALTIRPGSSLELDVGAESDIQQFFLPECDKDVGCSNVEDSAALNSRLGTAAVADLSWKFFPKTAVVASYEYGRFNWSDNFVNTQGDGLNPDQLGNYLGIPDGKWWHVDGGLRGRFTDKIVLGTVVGYTVMTYDEASVIDDGSGEADALPVDLDATGAGFDTDLKGVTASVELGYDVSENQQFVLSYGRDYQDVFFTNYVGFNRVTGALQGTAWKRLDYELTGMYRRESYQGEVARDDHFLRVAAAGAFEALDWMDVTGGVAWSRRASVDGANPAIEFDDTRLNLGVRFQY